jgi:hypothetical protein
MKTISAKWLGALAMSLVLLASGAPSAFANEEPWDDSPEDMHARVFQVTITNLTSGQPMTPPVVATHRRRASVFTVGNPASFGVKEIAENGNNAPLLADLDANRKVYAVQQAGAGPLVPAGTPGSANFPNSVTFTIGAGRGANRLSVVAMLICTNDGLTGLDSIRLPKWVGDSKEFYTAGYDAGTERNTEDFADIVPPCQGLINGTSNGEGAGTSNPALAEGGVIQHHPGIQGIADLQPNVQGWTDPVMKVVVTRVQ